MTTDSVEGVEPNVKLDSAIFKYVDAITEGLTTKLKRIEFDPPAFNENLLDGVQIDAFAMPKLEQPQPLENQFNLDLPPPPALTAALYTAAASLDLAFDAITGSPQYADGKSHKPLPNLASAAAPLGYPIAAQLAVPAPPDIAITPRPQIELGEHPDLTPIEYQAYQVQPIGQFEFDVPLFDESLANLENPEFLCYPNKWEYKLDTGMIAYLKRILAGEVGELDIAAGSVDTASSCGSSDEPPVYEFAADIAGQLQDKFEATTPAQGASIQFDFFDKAITQLPQITDWMAPQRWKVIRLSRSKEVEDKFYSEAEQILVDAAKRNFSAPTGDMNEKLKQFNNALFDEEYKILSTIEDEVYKFNSNLIVLSIKQAMVIERYRMTAYLDYLKVHLTILRQNVQLAIKVYQTFIQLYNEAVKIISLQLDAYNSYVGAVETQNRGLTEQLALSEVMVRDAVLPAELFKADAGTIRALARAISIDAQQDTISIRVWRDYLQAQLKNLEISKINISAYREAVQAFAQTPEQTNAALGAFEAAISTELSQAEVTQANVAVYNAFADLATANMQAYENYVDKSYQLRNEEFRSFRQALAEQERYLSYINRAAEEEYSLLQKYSTLVSQDARSVAAYNQASIAYTSAVNDLALFQSELDMEQLILDSEAKVNDSRLDIAKRGFDYEAAGALSQSASAMYQKSINTSGGVQESVSGSESTSRSRQTSSSKTWSKSCKQITNSRGG